MKTRKKTDSQHYVIWTDEDGTRKVEPFDKKVEAYEFMVSKLSIGNWACFPENARILRNTM
tara:strand:- start:973 stop:1155 length:183 start_codon:yes stop_codon:yes gene_type:complete